MTSFATDDAIRAHLAERHLGEPHRCGAARGTASAAGREPVPRCPTGGRRCTARGTATSLQRFATSGTLDALVAAGVRSVIVSNVDNLAARVDPAIVGMHVLAGTPLTVEVVPKGT